MQYLEYTRQLLLIWNSNWSGHPLFYHTTFSRAHMGAIEERIRSINLGQSGIPKKRTWIPLSLLPLSLKLQPNATCFLQTTEI